MLAGVLLVTVLLRTSGIRQGAIEEEATISDVRAQWLVSGIVRSDVRIRVARDDEWRTLRLWEGTSGRATSDKRHPAMPGTGVSVKLNAKVRGLLASNSDRSLPNVFVTLSRSQSSRASAIETVSPVMVNIDERRGFNLRSFVAQVGSKIRIRNSGNSLLKVTYPEGYSVFDCALVNERTLHLQSKRMPMGASLVVTEDGQSIPLPCGNPGDLVVFSVDEGDNGFAIMLVSDHRVNVVSKSDGSFTLPPLPNGHYELLAIHEVLGRVTKSVVINGSSPPPVEIVFKVPEDLRDR